MEIIVIGGGIGGLTLALTLHATGQARRIRVFEAAAEMRALGVGINIGAHAMKELSALGLEDELVATSCQPQDYAFFTRHGQLVYREPFGKAAGHQWPHISLLRPDLQRVLLGAVRERIGAENFITGHRCTGVEQSGGARHRAFRRSGRRGAAAGQQGDVLIACDGIHSAVRTQFYPDEGPFSFRGYNLWRGIDAAQAVPDRREHRPHRRAALDHHHLSAAQQLRRRGQPAGQLGLRDRARRGGAGRLEQAGAARGFPADLSGLGVRLDGRAGADPERRTRSCPIRWSTAIRCRAGASSA